LNFPAQKLEGHMTSDVKLKQRNTGGQMTSKLPYEGRVLLLYSIVGNVAYGT